MSRPKTVTALFERAARENPGGLALVCGPVRLAWRDYTRAIEALAARLAAARGGVVAILLRNSAAVAIAVPAAQRAGAAACALNPDYTAAELAPMLADAAPAVVVCEAALVATVAGLTAADVIAVGDDAAFVGELLASASPALPPPPEPDDLAVIQFTGGTTGRAKGVELTHRAVALNVWQREARLPTRWGDERVVAAMPLFHSFGQAMCLNLMANCAGTLVVLPRYRPDWLVAAVRDEGVTRLPAGPTMLASLLGYEGLGEADWSGVRAAWSGSAPLPVETLARWERATGVPVFEGYGQSEAGPVLTYQGEGSPPRPGSVGTALPETEIAIVDVNDPSRRLGAGEAGQIAARGPQIMRGYRGLADATAAAFHDGWLLTGDVGVLDADGVLTVTDRLKDMAIVGGYNVYPREVDEVLAAMPGVRAAAAVGVPDAYRGEVIAAFVVGAVDADAVAAWCAGRLVAYKRPARVVMVEALPLTAVGKVDKVALKRLDQGVAHVD